MKHLLSPQDLKGRTMTNTSKKQKDNFQFRESWSKVMTNFHFMTFATQFLFLSLWADPGPYSSCVLPASYVLSVCSINIIKWLAFNL